MFWTNLLKSSLLTGSGTSFPRKEEGKDGLALDQLSLLMICVVSYFLTVIFY